jgi:phenylacetate-coenzyme A ligase PaaK-like adenylate-forming protein
MLLPPPDAFGARCTAALEEALGRVAAYRRWRAFDPGAGAGVDRRYAALPALTKRAMARPEDFVPPGRSLEEALRAREVELVTTSGSTDDKITNVWCQGWWDASERASWALNAHAARVMTGTHREAILVSPLNVGVASERGDLPMERRRVGRLLYLNDLVDPLAWPEGHYRRMIAELDEYRPAVLEANPSLLSRLSRWAVRHAPGVFQPELIVFTYEYPSAIHRRHIGRVFRAPQVSSYGTTEAGYVFVECEHGRLHQNAASCRVDLVPFAARCGGPRLGQLLVTTLDNPWRALLRFDVGDLGRLADGHCPCGRREGLTLAAIEGRTINLTVRPDGAPVTQAQVDAALAAVPGVDEYDLRQADARRFRLKVGGDAACDARLRAQARDALAALYGAGAAIEVEAGTEFPPEPSGKHRLVRAAFPVDAARFLDPGARPPDAPETE